VNRSALVWLLLAVFSSVAFYEAGKLPFGRLSVPGSGFFPTVLAAVLAVISFVGLFRTFGTNGVSSRIDSPLLWGKIFLTVTLLLAFAALFESAGYLVTAFLFVLSLLRIVERKSWMQAGIVAFSASLVSYMIFGLLLGTPLPSGFLCL
jgi:Tripartite tricarboxylate transporter TctB family